LRLHLSPEAESFLAGMDDHIARAQIRAVLQALASLTYTGTVCISKDYPGGSYAFVGVGDRWKITFHVVDAPEPVLSVVTIKKRRTLPWALEFYPKRDCNE
jgi:hypothetical protein